MLPGPDLILACPHCKALGRLGTLASGNTFGATLWSDGCLDAPMLPEQPAVTRCPRCRRIFWIEDAAVLGEYEWYAGLGHPKPVPAQWTQAPALGHLDVDGLATAITFETVPERLLHLSIRLWQRLNDPCRSTGSLPDDERFVPNLERIESLLDAAVQEERLMKAEACRQLGRFEAALSLLAGVPPEHGRFAERLRTLATAGERGVVRLEMD